MDFAAYGTLRYHCDDPKVITIRIFGTTLEPRYIFGARFLD